MHKWKLIKIKCTKDKIYSFALIYIECKVKFKIH